MVGRLLLIPIAIVGLHSSYIYISKIYKNKKLARNEILIRFFILFMFAIIAIGISSRGWN